MGVADTTPGEIKDDQKFSRGEQHRSDKCATPGTPPRKACIGQKFKDRRKKAPEHAEPWQIVDRGPDCSIALGK